MKSNFYRESVEDVLELVETHRDLPFPKLFELLLLFCKIYFHFVQVFIFTSLRRIELCNSDVREGFFLESAALLIDSPALLS